MSARPREVDEIPLIDATDLSSLSFKRGISGHAVRMIGDKQRMQLN